MSIVSEHFNVYLSWLTSSIALGSESHLQVEDLPQLPSSFLPTQTRQRLQQSSISAQRSSCCRGARADWVSFVKLFLHTFWFEFLVLGIYKFFITSLSFAGPLLLGTIVSFLENDPSHNDLIRGLILVGLLFLSFSLSAIFNTRYNVLTTILQLKLKGALVLSLFSRVIAMTAQVIDLSVT